jgi:hypothetical protein
MSRQIQRIRILACRGHAGLGARASQRNLPRKLGSKLSHPIGPRHMYCISRFFNQRIATALLAASLLLVGGCSMFKLAYNNVDVAINWVLDGYFNLHAEQHALLKARVESLQTWHRKYALPEYIEGLRAAQQKARNPITRDDVDWFVGASLRHYGKLAEQAAPGAADLLVTLSPAQINTMQAKMAKDNKKFAKEHKLSAAPEAQREARAKRMIELAEDWVGNLSGEQEARIRQTLQEWPLYYPLSLANRERRQRELVSLIETHRDARELAPLLSDWLQNYEQGRAPEYAALAQQNKQRGIDLALQIDAMLTPKQRGHLIDKLQTYMNDFSSLSHVKQAEIMHTNPFAVLTER